MMSTKIAHRCTPAGQLALLAAAKEVRDKRLPAAKGVLDRVILWAFPASNQRLAALYKADKIP